MSTATLERHAPVDAHHLEATPLLDYRHPRLQALIRERGWSELGEADRIGAIYDFVRDEIPFGYNASDRLPASAVLADGYGQCNTKATVMMALLRAVGIPCRLHGATVEKRLQRGIVPELFYRLWQGDIVHSWVEVLLDDRWIALEGVVLDRDYLEGVRANAGGAHGAYCGFAVGTDDLTNPPIAWRGTDTAIQKAAVNNDFGVFDDPEGFFGEHDNFTGVKGWLFRRFMQSAMNRKVASIRAVGSKERAHREQVHQDERARNDDD